LVYHTDDVIQELAADLLNTPYYRAKIKGHSDLLSKYYKRIGIFVKTEDIKLQNNISEVIIRYKIKVLEIAKKDRIEKFRMTQEAAIDKKVQNQLLIDIKNLTEVLKQLYSIIGQVVCQ